MGDLNKGKRNPQNTEDVSWGFDAIKVLLFVLT